MIDARFLHWPPFLLIFAFETPIPSVHYQSANIERALPHVPKRHQLPFVNNEYILQCGRRLPEILCVGVRVPDILSISEMTGEVKNVSFRSR